MVLSTGTVMVQLPSAGMFASARLTDVAVVYAYDLCLGGFATCLGGFATLDVVEDPSRGVLGRIGPIGGWDK